MHYKGDDNNLEEYFGNALICQATQGYDVLL